MVQEEICNVYYVITLSFARLGIMTKHGEVNDFQRDIDLNAI